MSRSLLALATTVGEGSEAMTSQPGVLQTFTASIRASGDYPENLLQRTIYLDALKTYKSQLDEIERKLFVTRDDDVNVPFRDLIDLAPGKHTSIKYRSKTLTTLSVREKEDSR